MPYRVTSTVTAFIPGELIEWRHPLGHRWRWEFTALSPTLTRVTETYDYRNTGPVKDRLRFYERTGFAKTNGGRGLKPPWPSFAIATHWPVGCSRCGRRRPGALTHTER